MIFINESLTRTNRKNFSMCRNFKKNNNWEYAWTKQGQTYLEKSDSDNTLKIESIYDLSKYKISFNHKRSSSCLKQFQFQTYVFRTHQKLFLHKVDKNFYHFFVVFIFPVAAIVIY